MRSIPFVIASVLVLLAPVLAQAQTDLSGSYATKVTASGKSGTATLTVEKSRDGYDVSRSTTFADGTTETLHGTGRASGSGWLRVTIPLGPGIVANLNLRNPGRASDRPITGTYRFYGKGKVWGRLTNPDKVGGWTSSSENGGKDVPTDAGIVSPKEGGRYLIGQIVKVVTQPPNASWDVSGAAERTADGRLRFTGPGDATLTAGSSGRPVKVSAIGLEVVEITVEKAQPIVDAAAPQFQRKLGSPIPSRKEPAAILMNETLTLRVTVQGSEDLSEAANVKLVGSADGRKLEGAASILGLKGGQAVTVMSLGALNPKVAVNPLVIFWSVECEGKAVEAGATTPLRVYTSYKPAVSNIGRGPAQVNSKLHFEMACTWANGASQNIGQGSDSIAYQCDNQMRHYVHPVDFKKEVEVPAYAKTSQPPINYRDLPGDWSVRSSGERGVTSLYYPPLEPKKPYEQYENYRGNFGWNLVDNPTHTGGRCNQQASFVCDIVGTLGIKAQVHYLERTGMGKRTGRPVRNYFYAQGGSGPWNFHGIARTTLASGSEWLYDGSFSSPPNRLNGERAWAEKPGGPFLQKWGPWYYEDAGGQVPADDIPTTWSGIQ